MRLHQPSHSPPLPRRMQWLASSLRFPRLKTRTTEVKHVHAQCALTADAASVCRANENVCTFAPRERLRNDVRRPGNTGDLTSHRVDDVSRCVVGKGDDHAAV